MPRPRVEVVQSRGGWRLRFRAANGEILDPRQISRSPRDAMRGVAALRRVVTHPQFEWALIRTFIDRGGKVRERPAENVP